MPSKISSDLSKDWPRKANSSDNKDSVSKPDAEPIPSRYARSTASTAAKITQRHPIPSGTLRTTSRRANPKPPTASGNTTNEQRLSSSTTSLTSGKQIQRQPRKRLEHLNQDTSSVAETSINSYPGDHEAPSEDIESTSSISQIRDPIITDAQYPSSCFSNPDGTPMEINSFPGTAQSEILSSIHDSRCETSRVLFKTPVKQDAKILPSEKTSDDIHINVVSKECYPSACFSNPNGTPTEINSFPGTAQSEILSSIHDSRCETSRVLFKTPEKQDAEILASEKTSNDIHINVVSKECYPSACFSNSNGTPMEINSFPGTAQSEIVSNFHDSRCETSRQLFKTPEKEDAEILASEKTSDDIHINVVSKECYPSACFSNTNGTPKQINSFPGTTQSEILSNFHDSRCEISKVLFKTPEKQDAEILGNEKNSDDIHINGVIMECYPSVCFSNPNGTPVEISSYPATAQSEIVSNFHDSRSEISRVLFKTQEKQDAQILASEKTSDDIHINGVSMECYPSASFSNPNGTPVEISSFPGTAQSEIVSNFHDSRCEISRVLFKTPEKQDGEILASEKTTDDIDGVTMECFVWEEALEIQAISCNPIDRNEIKQFPVISQYSKDSSQHSHILPDADNNNGNSIACTDIASSLPELCSSESSTANSSIHGTDDSGGLKCDTVIPTLIKRKASAEEPDDVYLKHEDFLTERMRYKNRIESGNLILYPGKLCLF